LTITQEEVKRQGHAIEVRIYAEDPKTFYPSPGKITKLVLPQGAFVRNELAIEEESLVTPYYDPMIAKLIVKGNNRDEAIANLQKSLAEYQVEGIKTNIPMLQNVANHSAFKSGDTTTNFVTKYLK